MTERDFDFEKLGVMVDFVTPGSDLIASYTGENMPIPDEGDVVSLVDYTVSAPADEMEPDDLDVRECLVKSVDLHYVTARVRGEETESERTFSVAVVTATETEGEEQ